jgi:hypothetical protein
MEMTSLGQLTTSGSVFVRSLPISDAARLAEPSAWLDLSALSRCAAPFLFLGQCGSMCTPSSAFACRSVQVHVPDHCDIL